IADNLSPKRFTRSYSSRNAKSINDAILTKYSYYVLYLLVGFSKFSIVEYALRESNKPIGVAAYRIVSTLPKELRDQLPAPELIAKLLEDVK
ncbi:MAG: hypothetical protein O8C62_04740, partial [Candidatus Methanoperedens sp.]|nr:hypothetical protein [Candidatus Methanoperedens sp.]